MNPTPIPELPWDEPPKPKGTLPIFAAERDEAPATMAQMGVVVPVAYGTVKAPVLIIEKLAPLSQDPPAWVAGGTYTLGYVVQNGGNAYECTFGGVAAGSGGPSGTGASIGDGTVTWKYRQLLPCPLYFQRFIGAICEGQAQAGVTLFRDKELLPAASGTLFAAAMELKLGPDAGGQTIPLAFDQTGYQHTVLIAPLNTAIGMPSGTQKEVQNLAIEIQTVMFGAATADVNPADIVNDLITHARRGAGLPGSRVDASITGTGAGGMRVYCDAAGLRISMLLDSQKSGLAWIDQVFQAVNVNWLWDGGVFVAAPLGDQPLASPVYGATGYVPANAVQFNLTADDFLDKLNPVSFDRREDSVCYNNVPVEYINRARGYAKQTEEAPDALDVEKRGGKVSAQSAVALPVIFPDGVRPVMLSQIWTQRSLKVRNTYRFRLSWKYVSLRPGDLVTLTDTVLGLSLVPVRITTFEEAEDGTIQFTAMDYPAAVQAAVPYTPQVGDGYKANEAGTTQALTTQTPADQLTNRNPHNLWPNGHSEGGPPSTFAPAGDGSNAEYDFRFNAGTVNAYNGEWVRRLILTAAGTVALKLTIPCSPGESYGIIHQFKYISTGGTPTAVTNIQWLDKDRSVIAGPVGISHTTGMTTWTSRTLSGGSTLVSPANAVYVQFLLQLSTAAAGTAECWFDAILALRTAGTDHYTDLSVTGAKIANLAVGTAQLTDANVTTAKIADANVTTAKIADANVTTAKLADANVTRAKLASVGEQVSSSCGASASTTSATYADITNLTVTLTTTGRAVMVVLQPDGVGGGNFADITMSTSAQTAQIAIVRDGTVLQEAKVQVTSSAPAWTQQLIALDVPSAGSHTYKIQAKTSGGASVNFGYYKLVAYEL